jgi:hypothetical protein
MGVRHVASALGHMRIEKQPSSEPRRDLSCRGLFEGESYRSGDATLLEGHRRHATVAIERLK